MSAQVCMLMCVCVFCSSKSKKLNKNHKAEPNENIIKKNTYLHQDMQSTTMYQED